MPSLFDQLTEAQRVVAEQKARQALDSLREKEEELKAQLAAQILQQQRLLCATLKGFTFHFWDVIEPDTKLQWNWHLDVLCADLEEMYYLGDDASPDCYHRIFNVPPGTMKSILVSVIFRAWVWSKNPSKRFLTGSYSGHLSTRDNVKLRDIVQSPKYQLLFPEVVLSGDQNAKQNIATTKGGWSLATSVDGLGTGEHPDFIIIDDPISAQQARSDADRKAANQWVDRTLSSRGVARNRRVIVIMQRLHVFDLTGHLMQKGGWRIRVFPMRFVPTREAKGGDPGWTADPADRRTRPGELLWEELFNEQKVATLENNLGPYGAAGQLQQSPVPEGGGLFKREKAEIVDTLPPEVDYFVRGWDTAATADGGDYTVGVKMGEDVKSGIFYVVDVKRDQLDPDGVDAMMLQAANLDGSSTRQREQREPAAAGKSVINARRKLLKAHDYDEVPNGGDKVTNSGPLRSQWNAGKVKLLRGPWNEAFLQELSFFPVGENDDQVDGASTAYNRLVVEPKPEPSEAVW